MLSFLNMVVFTWLLIWAIRGVRRLMSGKSSMGFLYFILFIVNGLPLFLDEVVGKPPYTYFPGFKLASDDWNTGMIYCGYVAAIPLIWWLLEKREPKNQLEGNLRTGPFSVSALKPLRPLFFLLMLGPPLALFLAPNPAGYLSYAWIISGDPNPEQAEYHNIIALFTNLAVLGGAGLISSSQKVRLPLFLVISPLLLMALWLNGKRYIFAIAVVLIWLVIINKGYVKKHQQIVTMMLMLAMIGSLSFAYQTSVRSFRAPDLYQSNRMDFGRDDVVKMTIYAELNSTRMEILEFRGQSFLFHLTMFVPRDWWPEKPLPYAQYATSAMLLSRPRFWGWGITTSWLEEAIANLSWWGLLIGPLLPGVICRIGDSYGNTFLSSLSGLVASLFLAVHLSAFAWVFISWIATVVWIRRWVARNRFARRSRQMSPSKQLSVARVR